MDSPNTFQCALNVGLIPYFRTSVGGPHLISPQAASSNTWTHFTFVRRSSGREIWMNGALVTNDNAVHSISGATVLYFCTENNTGSYHRGFLDDVRIYNRALLHEEIEELYRKPYSLFEKTKTQFFVQQPAAAPSTRRRVIIVN